METIIKKEQGSVEIVQCRPFNCTTFNVCICIIISVKGVELISRRIGLWEFINLFFGLL